MTAMSNHEEYVTYQQAVKLKQLGFNWLCRTWYKREGEFYDQAIPGNVNSSPRTQRIMPESASAPTQAVAMRWLRKVHKISIEPICNTVAQWNVNVCTICVCGEILWGKIGLDTYEAALSAGIDAALELIGKEEEE